MRRYGILDYLFLILKALLCADTHGRINMGDISRYFDRDEFVCKCGCGKSDIDLDLVDRLDFMRMILKGPIQITSGCRCEKYNKAVQGKPDSAHLYGKAADIKILSSAHRFAVLSACMQDYTDDKGRTHKAVFDRIGIGQDFIHLGIGSVGLVWTY